MNSAVGCKGQVKGNNVEKAWAEFKEGVLSMAAEVCGMRQAKCELKRTKWWKNEVKEAVKKKVVCIVWLQQKTSEAREEYHQAKRKAKRVVRKAQDENG